MQTRYGFFNVTECGEERTHKTADRMLIFGCGLKKGIVVTLYFCSFQKTLSYSQKITDPLSTLSSKAPLTFVQSAVNACRLGNGNPIGSFVAKQ